MELPAGGVRQNVTHNTVFCKRENIPLLGLQVFTTEFEKLPITVAARSKA
jgi:hypothetical protein